MAFDDDRYDHCRRRADEILKRFSIGSLPVDPLFIAGESEISVEAKPPWASGVSGMLCKNGDSFGILFATHIDNEGFQRFSICHELGHYFLDGHVDHLFDGGRTQHESRSGFVSDDPYELEADHFAAGLLMPRRLFSAELGRVGEGLRTIEKLAELCGTSLTATAIQYARCVEAPSAIVVSSGGRVDYCFMSRPLREVRGLTWLRKGTPVPSGTITKALASDGDRVERGNREDGTSSLAQWFDGDDDVELTEEVVGLGSYGKVLTVLSADDIPGAEDEEDDDESDEWEPATFHRSRRR
jgi:hypothetical protein